ncbi:hypothetical protein FACS1894163_04550 [Spirochaetia bacterium]|nr:hypothetical protein FACS1894163_04550 [Spirochaetia bacterium]
METATLNLVKEYPQYMYPGHRSKEQSENSGEEFRDTILIPFLKKNEDKDIVINFSGVVGFPPSFLDEAFAGCIRKGINKITAVSILGVDEIEQTRIKRYIEKAINELKKKETDVH